MLYSSHSYLLKLNVQCASALQTHSIFNLKINVVPLDSVEVNDDGSQDVKKESEKSQVSNV